MADIDMELPPLPGLLSCDYDFTMDYGGSVVKVIHKKKSESGEERLYVRSISGGDHDSLFALTSGLRAQGGRELTVTGVGCKQYSKELQKGLDVKFNVVPEFECFIQAFRILTDSLKYSDMFSEIPRDQFQRALRITKGFAEMINSLETNENASAMKFSGDDESAMMSTDVLGQDENDLIENYHKEQHDDLNAIFPCLVVMCGSGFACHKLMSKDSPGEMAGYSPRGGRTLLGLGSLLTGAQSFDELVGLAAKGNGENVDQYIKSLKGGDADEFYDKFPDEALSFCFGHAFKKSKDSFKKEDLAASVVNLICNDLAQFSITMAMSSQCKNVIFCGSILNHQIVIDHLAKSFLENALHIPPQAQPKMHVCTLGPFLGAIGVWAIAAEAQGKKNKDEVKEKGT